MAQIRFTAAVPGGRIYIIIYVGFDGRFVTHSMKVLSRIRCQLYCSGVIKDSLIIFTFFNDQPLTPPSPKNALPLQYTHTHTLLRPRIVSSCR